MSRASKTVRLTAKRQVTFPREVCEELGVEAGDQLILHRRIVDGEPMWILRPARSQRSWLGSLQKFAHGKDHAMDAVRASIARKRSGRRRA